MGHSPGPWRWNEADGLLVDANRQNVAFAAGYEADGVCIDNPSDAALIAAAPRMWGLVRRFAVRCAELDGDCGVCAGCEHRKLVKELTEAGCWP